MENEIIHSVPKSLKQKARRLLDKIKRTVSWNDRGEMVYRNAPVPRSNIVDFVNDALRKRQSFQPVAWKMFARGPKEVNALMDSVGNPERWIYIQTTTLSVAGGASKETTPSRAAVVDVHHRRRRRAYLVSPTPLCNTRLQHPFATVAHYTTVLLRHGWSRR